MVERALAESGVHYSIVRPTWTFGGGGDVLTNNIAWILRRMPIFALPGSGSYPVQPVHVEDLGAICIDAAGADGDLVFDAAGPERMPFRDLVAAGPQRRKRSLADHPHTPTADGCGGAAGWDCSFATRYSHRTRSEVSWPGCSSHTTPSRTDRVQRMA